MTPTGQYPEGKPESLDPSEVSGMYEYSLTVAAATSVEVEVTMTVTNTVRWSLSNLEPQGDFDCCPNCPTAPNRTLGETVGFVLSPPRVS